MPADRNDPLVLTRRAWSQPRALRGGTCKVHMFIHVRVEEESDCSKGLTHARQVVRGRKLRTEEKRARERRKGGKKTEKHSETENGRG